MKITPLEIRQKEFEKKLRGYDKDEVTAFLLSLSNEWERVLDTNKELNIKLQHAEKEVAKLREVESSLYKTLKTAEDTGANLIDQSNKAAELHMKETQMKAEALMNEAKSKARAMMEKAEVEARQIIEELQEAVKSIEQNHRDIENHRQNAIAELKNLSVDLIEKVERTNKEQRQFKFDDYVKRVKELARESGERIKSEDTELNIPDTPKIEDVQDKEDEPEPEAPEQKKVPREEEPPKADSTFRTINQESRAERISHTVVVEDEDVEVPEKESLPPKTDNMETSEPEPDKPEKVEPEEKPAVEDKSEPANEEPEIVEPDALAEPEPVEEEPEPVEEEPEAMEEELEEVEEEPEPEPVSASAEPPPEPKKEAPKASKTVSFFDELDDED